MQWNDKLRYGVVTINDIREQRGYPPVPWGDEPWLPVNQAPVSVPRLPPPSKPAAPATSEP
jgi:hypothetical protein